MYAGKLFFMIQELLCKSNEGIQRDDIKILFAKAEFLKKFPLTFYFIVYEQKKTKKN